MSSSAAGRLTILISSVDLRGGTGTYTRGLALALKQFSKSQLRIVLLLVRESGLTHDDRQIFDETRILGKRVSVGWRRVLEVVAHGLQLRRFINAVRPDIVLGVATYSNLLSSIVTGRTPLVLTEHLCLSERHRRARFGSLIRYLVRSRYERHVVVAPVKGVAEDLARNYSVSDVQVIPHGINGDLVRKLALENVSGSIPRFSPGSYVVSVGRLCEQKDQETLLRAYAISGIPERLVIIGEGDDEPKLATLAGELGIAQNITFTGHQDNPFPLIQAAKCLVLSSRYEGFGLVLVEAMALGVPCISTDCPSGPGEILGGGRYGVLVPVGDVRALASALEKMASDDVYRDRFARLAVERVKDFTLERMARRYEEVLWRVLGRSQKVRTRS